MNSVHFIGIGGIGMSGLALLALEKGMIVSGSDLSFNAVQEKLKQKGALIYQGHDSSFVPKNAQVVYSSDIKPDNPEKIEAQRRGLPILHRSDFLSQMMKGKKALLVTGTHGKTTTSTLLAHTLTVAGYDPGFALGGISLNYGTNAKYTTGAYFVAEADESDSSHLRYSPEAAIVTNIDNDHIAHYGSVEGIEQSMFDFLDKVDPCYQIYCKDDPRLRRGRICGQSYGFHEDSDVRILEWRACEGGSKLFLHGKGAKKVHEFFLPLFGRHNGMNAAAVFLLANNLGIDPHFIKKAFASFQGVKRRMENKCSFPSFDLFDDYAHHPTEVRATLRGIREAYPGRRIIAFFQPHRPSRMKHVLSSFPEAFCDADLIVLTDLYLSSEKTDIDCTNESIRTFIQESHPSLSVKFTPRENAVSYLYDCIRPHDVVVCMGAGDSTKIAQELGLLLTSKGLPSGLKV